MRIIPMIAAAGFAVSATVAPAQADRPPTPDERVKIEGALKDAGFSTWKSIEFDDGRWEIDDAIASDGRKYDLKLDRQSLAVVERDLDD